MSTTFEVFPGSSRIPSYREIVDLAQSRIDAFLREHDVALHPRLVVDVLDPQNRSLGIPADAPFDYEGDGYSWFYFEGLAGGTDAYFRKDDYDREGMEEELASAPGYHESSIDIRASIEIGHQWWFRRSAGQPALVALSYGLIASALAELTKGFLYSGDCAWDYERFPCDPDTFYAHWFRPESALEETTRDWHQGCLDSLRKPVG